MRKPNLARVRTWKKHVDALQASDLGPREYCRKAGIKEATLKYWRKRLEPDTAAAAQNSAQLVPVQVVNVRHRGVEAALRLSFPALGAVDIHGDFAAVTKLLQLIRWEAV